jgi:hypothetical protein
MSAVVTSFSASCKSYFLRYTYVQIVPNYTLLFITSLVNLSIDDHL